MSLLVVHSELAPNPLFEVLSNLTSCSPVANIGAARSALRSGRNDVIVVTTLRDATELLCADPLLDVVLVSDSITQAESVLTALRTGVLDVLNANSDRASIQAQFMALETRSRQRQLALNHRVQRQESEIQRDQRAGRLIQLGMLPPNPMMIGDYVLRHRVVPSSILSGDFVDYFSFAQHYLAAYVADVSGHGASSAFVTVLLKNFSRRIRREYRVDMLDEPGLILAWLNRELLEQKIDKHVTMALVLIDLRDDTLIHVNAGHYPQAVVVRATGEVEFLDAGGKPVGLFPEVAYTAVTATIEPGDRLVLFSDGVLELLGEESLDAKEKRLLRAAAESDRLDDVWTSLGLVPEQQGPDDMSCLIISREP